MATIEVLVMSCFCPLQNLSLLVEYVVCRRATIVQASASPLAAAWCSTSAHHKQLSNFFLGPLVCAAYIFSGAVALCSVHILWGRWLVVRTYSLGPLIGGVCWCAVVGVSVGGTSGSDSLLRVRRWAGKG